MSFQNKKEKLELASNILRTVTNCNFFQLKMKREF